MSRLLSTAQAAAFLNLRPQTLRVWRTRGDGPQYIRLGSSIKARAAYTEASLADFVRSREFKSTAAESVAASTLDRAASPDSPVAPRASSASSCEVPRIGGGK